MRSWLTMVLCGAALAGCDPDEQAAVQSTYPVLDSPVQPFAELMDGRCL